MSLTRRRNEGIAISHKWEMWNVVDATRYREQRIGTVPGTYSLGQSVTYGASYSFDIMTGLYTLNDSQTIIIDSNNAYKLNLKYTLMSGMNNMVLFVTDITISSTRVNCNVTLKQSQSYTIQVKGDTFKGYIYGEDGAYPDNNYVGDTWYVKVY